MPTRLLEFRSLFKVALVLMALASAISVQAQVTTGTVRGEVTDQTGAVVPGATVTITDPKTKTSQTAESGNAGEYQFNNLPVGTYVITVQPPSSSNFSTLTLNDVRVKLNEITDVPTVLQPGEATASVTVSAGGAELVDSTSLNLAKDFSSRQVVDLAQTGQGAGIYNLALISPNVVSSGGVGLGTGGSVGGQRPRDNDFIVDGIDNNDKAVSGPQIYVSPESVAEFNLLTNQASAEFARSTGGQFITVTKSGGNDFHGSAFEFFRNKDLNALDNLQKLSGITRDENPRFDQNRYGFNIGGPLYLPRFGEGGPRTYPWSGKNKLFFFFQFEQTGLGQAASPGNVSAPTAQGLAILQGLSGVSATNLAAFRQFVPVAPSNNAGTIPICAVPRDASGNCPNASQLAVPIGNISFAAPNFQSDRNIVFNLDFNQSANTVHHSRFIFNRQRTIDNLATFPEFFALIPTDGRLFSYTLVHNFSPKLTNETRLAYRRYVQNIPSPDITFPGLDQFPNIDLDDLGLSVGPDQNAPQFTIENSYQVVDQATYNIGRHSLKFGVDWRNIISPQSFVQRQRGEYEYPNLDQFLRDVQPSFGERTVGASPYYGNQHLFYGFVQDDWKVKPRFTLNLGLNYVYQQVPFTARLQTINSIADVPGVLTFGEPKAQTKNFAPRFGLAYAPDFQSGLLHRIFGASDQSSIRASFAMAYDTIVDNLYILSLPPQFNQTIDVGTNFPGTPLVTPNFLANGGIPPTVSAGATTDPAAARAATSAWIPDQQVPYSLSWGLTFQREFHKDYAIEIRYLGSRGIHLPTQNRINIQDRVFDGPGGSLPTFFSAPSQATIDNLPTSLADIQDRSNIVPQYLAAGFTSPIAAFLANGNSTYHAGSASLTRRLSNGLQLSAAYTWSHLIDDSTAEVFSTVLSPRRVQDFQDQTPEKADSALDRRQRFVVSTLYDLPFFRKSSNHFARSVFGGVSMAATLAFESGEKATVLSGIDSNLNGDPAPDRAIVNPTGTVNTSSLVTPLLRSCPSFDEDGNCTLSDEARIVGYLADNPNAQYIQAGLGAMPNSGRNTLLLPAIKNLDFSIFKSFAIGEGSKKIQLRADFYNAFNHPQYVPGSVDGVEPIATTGVAQINTVGQADFDVASHVFSSHPRVIQLALRFDF
ncbi:MAG TPA: carboxypeptidase regulatory-like domain-containing protein [Pyrinomonadaceae bacterium]|nr:carboxypeptidase regulatory-like domain-containing protein [Pyrinomonadaceae bacterium]